MPKIDLLKFIQLKPLTALAIFPPGLGKQTLAEMESILSDPWIPEKKNTSAPKMILFPEKIMIRNCSIQFLIGLSYRSFFIRDLYLLLEDVSITDLSKDLPDSILDWMKESVSYSFQIQIRKNPNLDPKAFYEDCDQNFKSILAETKIQINNKQLISPRFLISTLRNKSNLYLAIRSKPQYQRGFRSSFSLSAPLSEDISSILLHKLIGNFSQNLRSSGFDAYIPFSGTGTFAFELLMQVYQIYPGLLNANPDEFVLRMNQTKTWSYIFEKARKLYASQMNSTKSNFQITNLDFRTEIVENAKENWNQFSYNIKQILGDNSLDLLNMQQNSQHWMIGDFFGMDFPQLQTNQLLIPMNPPYGIRHGNRENTESFYRRIAEKINTQCLSLPKQTEVHGFILCPDTPSYSQMHVVWQKHWRLETIHFSQGKLSIRALFFSRKS